MPVLDKSMLRRAEILGEMGIKPKLPDGCGELMEAGPGNSSGTKGAGRQSAVAPLFTSPPLLTTPVSAATVDGGQLVCLWVGLRVERSSMVSLCRSAHNRLKS